MLEHILVIEDDDLMRMSLETELSLAGYRVTVAENGYKALELARHHHFDLVVSDVRMAGMDGLQALSALKEVQPSARSIVITGYADPDAPIQAVKLKVDDYLLKPFTSDDLLRSVRQSLQAQLEELRKRRSTLRLRELMLRAFERAEADPAVLRRLRLLARRAGLSPARSATLQLAMWLKPICPELDSIEELKGIRALLEMAESDVAEVPLDAQLLRQAIEPDPCLHEEEEPPPAPLPSGAHNLLAIAATARCSGQLQLAADALQQTLAEPLEPELAAAAWLEQARLLQQCDDTAGARTAADQARQLAAAPGLERLRAEATLLQADLGGADTADLLAARDVFAWFEASAQSALANLWLAHSGYAEATGALLHQLALLEPRHLPVLADVLARNLHDPALSGAGDALLPVLRLWIDPSSPLERRLRALDLLALSSSPGARTLLAHGAADHPALAQKSQLFLEQSANEQRRVVQVRLLGRMLVSADAQPLADDGLSTRKIRGLFAYLATRRGENVSEEVLSDLFWQAEPAKAKHSLHNAVSQIRKALKAWLGDAPLLKQRDGYTLTPHPALWVDVEAFRAHCDRAGAVRGSEAALELKRAEELYRGDFLEGDYSDWTEAPRRELQERLVGLLARLAIHYADSGKPEVALDYWKRLIARDNLHEDAYLGCMQAQIALGRHGDAVRTYHQCAGALRQELNLPPPPRVAETYLQLLARQP